MCERSRDDRRVSTTWAWPSSSKRAHRTAAGRPVQDRDAPPSATSADGPTGSPRRSSAARTVVKVMRRAPGSTVPVPGRRRAGPDQGWSGNELGAAPLGGSFGPVRQPASTLGRSGRPAPRTVPRRRRPAPPRRPPGRGAATRASSRSAETAGLERGHDPARGDVAALPLHPRLEQFGRVGGRSVHGANLGGPSI